MSKNLLGVKLLLAKIRQNNEVDKIFIPVFLFTIAFLYFYNVLHLWFFCDDPASIVYSAENLYEILFVNRYSYAFYTPLLPLSFKPDVALFGMNPFYYHLHNVIVLALIASMVYLILRRYADRASSIVAAGIILLSAPSLVCIIWITLRQYLYSMLFALIALHLFLKYKPDLKNNKMVVFLIALLSELSFMGKEQYMTLPFIFFLLSGGGLRKRINRTFAYFLVLIAHFLLRWHVLGNMGGYLGIYYDPKLYLITVFGSILTASKVLFGFSGIVILVAIPFMLRPKKFILSCIVWLLSLSISFVSMYYYPTADTYRYWFIPVVLFSFAIGSGSSLLKNRKLKVFYLILITALFLNHSLRINEELKSQFRKETAVAKRISESMIDSRYRNSVILFPDNKYIIESGYQYNMAKAYLDILGIATFPSLYPLELIAFYPEILQNAKAVYKLQSDVLVDVTGSVGKDLDLFSGSLVSEKPEIRLFKSGSTVEISLKCKGGKGITGYTIKRFNDKYYITRHVLPYLERINLKPFITSTAVDALPVENLSYRNRAWYLGTMPIKNNTAVITVSCTDQGARNTRLSDILYVLNPK